MADENEEQIKITADVSSLKSRLAEAKAELKSFNNNITETTALMSRMGATAASQLEPHLTEMRNRAEALRTEIDGLQSSIKGATTAQAAGAGAATKATKELNFATSGAIQEYIRLGHEAMTGNFSRIPGSLVVLTSRLGGLTAATFGWTAAILVAAAAVGYLIYRAVEAQQEAQKINLLGSFFGSGGQSEDQIKAFINNLDTVSNVSRKDAENIVESFSKIKDITSVGMEAASRSVSSFALETGQTIPKATEELAKAFSDPIANVQKFVDSFHGATNAEVLAAQAAARSGNQYQALSVMLQTLKTHTDEHTLSINQNSAAAFASFGNFTKYITAISEGLPIEEAHQVILQHNTQYYEDNSRAIDQLIGKLHQLANTPQTVLTQGMEAGKEEDPLGSRLEHTSENVSKLRAEIKLLQDDIRKTGSDAEKVELTKAQHSLELATDSAKKLKDEINFGPVMTRARDEIAKFQATWDGSQAGMDTKEAEIWSKYLGTVRQGSEQYGQIMLERDRAIASAHRASVSESSKFDRQQQSIDGGEAINEARNANSLVIADTKKSEQEKLDAIHKTWNDLIAGTRLNARQLSQVRKEEADEETQIVKQAASRQEADDRETARANIQIAKLGLQEKRDVLEEEVSDYRITNAQKLASLKQYAQDEANLEIKAVQSEGLDAQQTADRIRVIWAKLHTDLAKIDLQIEQDAVTSWRGILTPIETATNSILNNIVTRSQTVGQLMRSVTQQLVLDFLTARVKIEFDWLAGQAAMALGAQQWANKSFLAWALGGAKEVIAETATTGKKVAVVTAGETAKTEAVAAGVAARTGIEAAGATASNIAEATSDSTSIVNSAYTAAAAAYRSIMMSVPPPANLALAPLGAAATFTAVMAYDVVTSLATGTMNVPHDMLAYIHEGESVVPKEFAQSLRETGSIYNQDAGGIHIHNSPVIHGGRQQSLEELVRDQPYVILDMLSRVVRNGGAKQVFTR